jgi:hypothetical protein
MNRGREVTDADLHDMVRYVPKFKPWDTKPRFFTSIFNRMKSLFA